MEKVVDGCIVNLLFGEVEIEAREDPMSGKVILRRVDGGISIKVTDVSGKELLSIPPNAWRIALEMLPE